MDDESVAEMIKKLTGKSAEQVGSIYKRLYKNVMEHGFIISHTTRAVGRISKVIGESVHRLSTFMGSSLFKKKEEEEE